VAREGGGRAGDDTVAGGKRGGLPATPPLRGAAALSPAPDIHRWRNAIKPLAAISGRTRCGHDGAALGRQYLTLTACAGGNGVNVLWRQQQLWRYETCAAALAR